MIIDQKILDSLTAAAKASPRLRMNYDLRNSAEDGSQRMLNAIEPGMVMPIHRHRVSIQPLFRRYRNQSESEVLNELEGTKPTFHEKIHIAQVREYDFDEVSREIDDLVETAKTFDNMAIVKKMKEIVPEYKSNNSVYEVLDGEKGVACG